MKIFQDIMKGLDGIEKFLKESKYMGSVICNCNTTVCSFNFPKETVRVYQIPYCCPVCNGDGAVQRPPNIAGDQPTWTASGTPTFSCKACKGTGIIWSVST